MKVYVIKDDDVVLEFRNEEGWEPMVDIPDVMIKEYRNAERRHRHIRDAILELQDKAQEAASA